MRLVDYFRFLYVVEATRITLPLTVLLFVICSTALAEVDVQQLKEEEQALLEREQKLLEEIGDIFSSGEARASLASPPPKAQTSARSGSGVTSFIDSIVADTRQQEALVVHQQIRNLSSKHQELVARDNQLSNAVQKIRAELAELTRKANEAYNSSDQALSAVHDLATRSLLLRTTVSELTAQADLQAQGGITVQAQLEDQERDWRQGNRYQRYRFPRYALQVTLPVRGRRTTHSEELLVPQCGDETVPCSFVAPEEGVNLRLEPDGEEADLPTIPKDEPLVIDYRSGDWYRVRTTDRQIGWVHSQELVFGPLQQMRPTSMIKVRGVDLGNGKEGPL